PSENKTSTSSFPNHQSQFEIFWRRGWDSNPRNGFPLTAFPVLPIQPLLHLSLRNFGLRISNFGLAPIRPASNLKLTAFQIRNPNSELRNLTGGEGGI